MTALAEKKVICPHCWSGFYGDKAMYISQHEDLYGDPVLGDVPMRVPAGEAVRSRAGNKVVDSKGWEMFERACPHCRLQVPLEMLSQRPKFISIVGAPGSGKTYFLTVMLHQLRKTLARQFKYTLDLCDTHDKQLLVANEKKLFAPLDPTQPVFLEKTQEQGGDLYNNVMLDGVSVQLPKPFMLTMRSTNQGGAMPVQGRQQTIVLYDNAGESFQFDKDTGQNRTTRHLGQSDAMMFAYDPLLEPEMRMRLARCSDDPQISTNARSARQIDFLTTAVQQMRRHGKTPQNQRLNASLAVCVQKFDVWRSLTDHCKDDRGEPVIDATSIEYFIEHGVAALDISEINIVSQIIRSILMDVSPDFVSMAEANFRRVRYFPVSALGQSPELDGDLLKIAPLNMQPFRVDHPMLWLMRDWRMIARTKDSKENPRNRPVASIESVSKTHFRTRCPKTRELFDLDHDFAGRDFYNPNTLEYFWIPAIGRIGPTLEPASQTQTKRKATQAGPPAGLGLKLSGGASEPKKKRKGWFR
ncbi:hypothetical protein [Rhodopirellula europaea]|uniref:Uncharacterized protein n=1 Tax=Rhodopirellula europaea SH398 TaxID=1263868 RepID=M5SAC0_9BACT|nr:hypothetical protein [Rhodopirellula europaea]EMI24612.1 hypothetical protein RESH_04983 [Rhodopirellula europaea SH398]